MHLSKRLSAVADLASAGSGVADIGTDHGYIPIFLIEEGRFEKGLAMDVKEGPLKRAEENIRKHGLEDRIQCRLSNGVWALEEDEVDTVVIAGMGGPLIIKILTEGRQILKGVAHLVLQPQSEIMKVREYLWKEGYCIEKEHMVLDEGKYYQVMKVSHRGMEKLLPEEAKYGPLLLKEKNACLREYLTHEEEKFLRIRKKISENTGDKAKNRMNQIEEALKLISKAKERIK